MNILNKPAIALLSRIFCGIVPYSMLLLPMTAIAQTPDRFGNYYRNETPIIGSSIDPKRGSGSMWRVVARGLNCRKSANLNSPIVRTYSEQSLLEVEIYRGGSDEVFFNYLDPSGRPWMPVRGNSFEDVCFVRANSLFIQPLTSFGR